MICWLCERLSPLSAGGELPRFIAKRVEAHGESCPRCAAQLRALRGDRDRIAEIVGGDVPSTNVPEKLGENFWLAIRRDLRTERLCGEEAEPRRPMLPLPSPVAPVSGLLWRGALAAAVIVLAVFLSNPGTEERRIENVRASKPIPVTPIADRALRDGSGPRDGASSARDAKDDDAPIERPLEGFRPAPRREVLDF